MPNEQTTVPLFVAAEILTAVDMNLSAGTGVPVFTNSTTRDAAFGGAGEKVLAEGQLCYLSDSNIVQYYSGASWATVGPASASALVRVGGGTLSGASTTFSNVFSATYDSYLILVAGVYGSTSTNINLKLGSTTTGYYWARNLTTTSATTSISGLANTSNFDDMSATGATLANSTALQFYLHAPFLTQQTNLSWAHWGDSNSYGVGAGQLRNSTSYTAFTLTMQSGTFSGGTVNIYGYSLS